MNQETENYIMQRMLKYLDNSQMIKLKDTLDESLRQSVDSGNLVKKHFSMHQSTCT
jgi:hypothetical protein